MSNPVATIGDTIPTPPDPSVTRKSYNSIVFNEQRFFVYGENEFDPTYTTFDPTDDGERFYIFVQLKDVLGDPGGRPEFINEVSWDETVKKAQSGFVTARYSIMPKIFIPSKLLVNNGIDTLGQAFFAFADTTGNVEAFNWQLNNFNGVPVLDSEIIKYGQVGPSFGSQYVSLRAKNDNSSDNVLTMSLFPPPVAGGFAPVSGPQGWLASESLVVGGAFVLMLTVVPSVPGTVDFEDVQENSWYLQIEFGQVKMEMNEIGAMKVTIDPLVSDAESIPTTVNLADGKMKEGPPQQQHVEEPFIIGVYPVWNGVVVQSGNQESKEVVDVSSTFCPMVRGRSVLSEPYSSGFDPSSPGEVEVGVGTGATNAVVDFGSEMTITAKNVRFELAYLPTFFSREMWFDVWSVESDDDPAVVSYSHVTYPIWTKNGTAAVLDPVTPTKSGFQGPLDDTSYWYTNWRLGMEKHARHAGEIFGEIVEITSETTFPIKNGNGNFSLIWAGGAAGDASSTGDWRDYVQSISISLSIDGSSGSITVDKYGLAGQDAVAVQSIGAVTIAITGGFGTVAGSIFQGLALGVSDNISSDGATWEVPLVGLEKKMEDIALINAPFLDGETAATAIRYLTRYAGLNVNFAGAPSAAVDRLSVSDDINVARFDWKSGTSVANAMGDLMDDLQYNYVVMDGTIFIYELDADGLPVFAGPNRQTGYTGTKVIIENQTPDFDVLRNDIVVLGLEGVPEGTGSDISNIPLFPRFARRVSNTTPDVPWAKAMVRAIPGTLTVAEIEDFADKLQAMTKNYYITGRTTIPGNADIRPYDRWGDMMIYSVSHNIDLISKSWTTDLEFSKAT